jgi:HEAT repeats
MTYSRCCGGLRRAAAIADFEDDARWAIIRELHRRTDRTAFDAVCALARSADIRERIVVLDVLAQIGYSASRPFLEETLPVLIDACDHGDADVVATAVSALGDALRACATEQPRGMSEA